MDLLDKYVVVDNNIFTVTVILYVDYTMQARGNNPMSLFFYSSRSIYIQFTIYSLKNQPILYRIMLGKLWNACQNRKDGFVMKNQKAITKAIGIKKAIAAVAKMATAANVNSACMFVAYQPKLPKDAKKLRKF